MVTTQPPSSRTLVLNVGQASSVYLVTELPAPPGTTAKRVRNTAHLLIQSLPCALELATVATLPLFWLSSFCLIFGTLVPWF